GTKFRPYSAHYKKSRTRFHRHQIHLQNYRCETNHRLRVQPIV
ncbi:MAG: hypothetical protein, partial [Olavius algarvensis Delta 4 endosymbiont]